MVIQLASNVLIAHYYPLFLEMAQRGEIDWQYPALMADRILVRNCKQQLYGTQVNKNAATQKYESVLIAEPRKVNKRRKALGMVSIEEYLEAF